MLIFKELFYYFSYFFLKKVQSNKRSSILLLKINVYDIWLLNFIKKQYLFN